MLVQSSTGIAAGVAVRRSTTFNHHGLVWVKANKIIEHP